MSAACRKSALGFIKLRPRSVAELRGKLEIKGFEAVEIDQTLQWLQEIELLNDRSFTRSWIQYRLARPFGFRRIIAELKEKGVSQAVIDEEIQAVRPETDEAQTAFELAERRWKKLTGVEPIKRKKRIFDFLVRRGFSPDIIFKTLKTL